MLPIQIRQEITKIGKEKWENFLREPEQLVITTSRENPWTSLLTNARSLAETSQSSVSVFRKSRWTQLAQQDGHNGSSDRSSGCTPCVLISKGSAHHRQISNEQLAALARVSPYLQPRLWCGVVWCGVLLCCVLLPKKKESKGEKKVVEKRRH